MNPNPDLLDSSPGGNPPPSDDNANSTSNSTATLGRSAGNNTNYTYNLDRFLDQDMCDDATLHGRVPEHAFHPHPTACVPFYEARAENAIGEFETAFAGSAGTAANGISAAANDTPASQQTGPPPA